MGDPCGFAFFWGELPEKRAQFFLGGCDLHRNYEGWIFTGRFKAGSVLGTSVLLKF